MSLISLLLLVLVLYDRRCVKLRIKVAIWHTIDFGKLFNDFLKYDVIQFMVKRAFKNPDVALVFAYFLRDWCTDPCALIWLCLCKSKLRFKSFDVVSGHLQIIQEATLVWGRIRASLILLIVFCSIFVFTDFVPTVSLLVALVYTAEIRLFTSATFRSLNVILALRFDYGHFVCYTVRLRFIRRL